MQLVPAQLLPRPVGRARLHREEGVVLEERAHLGLGLGRSSALEVSAVRWPPYLLGYSRTAWNSVGMLREAVSVRGQRGHAAQHAYRLDSGTQHRHAVRGVAQDRADRGVPGHGRGVGS